MGNIFFAILCLLYIGVENVNAQVPKTYKNGIVVSAHPEASKAGLQILKAGGNAVDAAVAVQFALAVVLPSAGNIGGGGFLVYRSASGKTNTLDYREKAPGAASRNMYLDSNGNAITEKSLYGHLAAGVPGTVDGMINTHLKYGKLKWKQIMQPAIELAEKGFAITEAQAGELNKNRDAFEKYNPSGFALIKDELWNAGDQLIQPELAHTLKLIRDKDRAGFYEGETAALIISEMKRGGGLITKKDLAAYRSVWRKPIVGKYKDFKIITMPPPSSGGIALMQLLHSAEPFPVKRWGFNADSTVQLIVEAERRVYADRSVYLGDPDFYSVPQEQLLSLAYQMGRMRDFQWNRTSVSTDIKEGNITDRESEETTHYSIADSYGNSVSVTTTLNGAYGSKTAVKEAGFLLNNEMDDFSVKPGSPNMYGLIGGEANAIEPGKRMLSSMTPTIIERNGKLFMVVGTPGGSTIITSVFQTILNVIEFSKPIQEAVTVPRFHHQWLPDEVFLETDALTEKTKNILIQKGYKLTPRGPIGRVDAILKTNSGYQGGADPRGDDTSLGY
ncbi:MAG: gamma-glutamyltransferase [Sphingobacteriales bacterium]|nr:gamma-glutamyltransferase [Sphingobacteriales bacterium]